MGMMSDVAMIVRRGWNRIGKNLIIEVTEEFIGKYKAEVSVLATEVFNIVVKDGDLRE